VTRQEAPDLDFAGHPHGEWATFYAVPAEIALAFDLANSCNERAFYPHSLRHDRRDLIATPAELEDWLRARGSDVEVNDEDLALTHRVRDALRVAARANVDPAARAEARAALREVASEVPLRVVLDDSGVLRVEGAADGVRGVLGIILAGAVAASGHDAWSRLKMCAAADCRWVFFDHSKPRTGRWCEMAVCGNRVKTREYRRRRAQ
jgi:predicted RNA-binding Zn ribbon-like protein